MLYCCFMFYEKTFYPDFLKFLQTVDIDFPNTTESYKLYSQVVVIFTFFLLTFINYFLELSLIPDHFFFLGRGSLQVTSKKVFVEFQTHRMMVKYCF